MFGFIPRIEIFLELENIETFTKIVQFQKLRININDVTSCMIYRQIIRPKRETVFCIILGSNVE